MSSASSSAPHPSRGLLAFISDQRFIRIVGQAIFLFIVVFLLVQLWNSIQSALVSRNLTPNFEFLQNRAGFAIGGAVGYSPEDSYWEAYLVGLRNTLSIVWVGLIGTTILGILGGILLLSSNWLIRNFARACVEIIRNTPHLIQLFFIFFVVVLSLPTIQSSIQLPGEGLLFVAFRYIVYVLITFVLWRILQKADQKQTDKVRLVALVMALFSIVELLLFFSAQNNTSFLGSVTPAKYQVSVLMLGLMLVLTFVSLMKAQEKNRRATLIGAGLGIVLGIAVVRFTGEFLLNGFTVELTPLLYLNSRGLFYPSFNITGRFAEWMAFVAIGLGLAVLVFFYLRNITEQSGKPYPRWRITLLILALFAIVGWVIVTSEPRPETISVSQDGALVNMPLEQAITEGAITQQEALAYASAPLEMTIPRPQGLRISGGDTLTPEYIALLLMLIIYTAGFIAEVVRAGILAVPRGQIEAARALGLGYGQMLQMVILPQALRVIIPPLTNQYLNLAKNSTLAIAISFADTYQVMNTVINQSGQSVTGIVLVMVTYLVISLVISGVMNWVNSKFQLVTR